MLWLHGKQNSAQADTLFNMKQTNDCYTSHTPSIVSFSSLYAPNSLLQRVFGCFFLFVFVCFFLLEVLVVTVCDFSAPFIPEPWIHFDCLVPRDHMHTFCEARCLNPESAHCVCGCLCMHLHSGLTVCFGWCHRSVLCHVLSFFFFWPLCVFGCLFLFMCVRHRSGRAYPLFIDCKEVLSVSVRAAEWLELVKPFSSPGSNPGDCCVDATLTAITDKFKRL